MDKRQLVELERRLAALNLDQVQHVALVFSPFLGGSDKYSLTVPETGGRLEFDTEAEVLAWLAARGQQERIIVKTVDGRRQRSQGDGQGILMVPPPMTEEQWETAVQEMANG